MNDDRPEPGEGVVLGKVPPEGGLPRRISLLSPPEDEPDFDPMEKRPLSPPPQQYGTPFRASAHACIRSTAI